MLAVAGRLGAEGLVESDNGVRMVSPRSCGEGWTLIGVNVDELLVVAPLIPVWSALRS